MYFTPTMLTVFADFLHFDEDIIVYDCETTGLTPVQKGSEPECHIIQLSAIRLSHAYMDGFQAVSEREWYIKPVETIPDKIVELTGITDEFLADKPSEAEVFEEIRDFFTDTAVVGYNNNGFDNFFMDEMYKRYGERFQPYLSLDMYPISQGMVSPKDVKNYKLATIASYFNLDDAIMFHNASGDVAATMSLMQTYEHMLIEREQKTGNMLQDYNAGVKVKVTGVSRYERGKMRRIYVNTADKDVSFYMETNLGWNCKDKTMSTDRFNMPDMISQALQLTGCRSERELAQCK